MSKRISSQQWTVLNSQFPDDIKNLFFVEVAIDRFTIFRRRSTRRGKPNKTNIQKFGCEFGEMLDWIEDNCNEPFYAKTAEALDYTNITRNVKMRIYFFDETDAMAFKLVTQ
jgi:hypothetical protein